MAAQIKDLRELTPKCKGINGRGDARERIAGAAKVLANSDPRTMAALVRVAMAMAESKKIRELIKDELYDMGRETHGTGYDEFKASKVTLEDVDYLDKVGLESVLDYLAAGAIVADSATEARQDTDIEIKKLKEVVKKNELENQPMKKSLRDMKFNLDDANRDPSPKYDPYSRDSYSRRDDRDRDDRGKDRRRDDDRDDRGRNRDRDDRGRDRRDDRTVTDRDRQEATSRRRRDDDRRDDRDSRRRDDDRTPRERESRDRRDVYDSRERERDYDRDFTNFAQPLYEGFRRVISGGGR